MNQLKIGDKIMIGVIVLLALGIFIYFLVAGPSGEGNQVVVEVNGTVVKTFSLPQKTLVEYKVEIDEDDYNLVQVEGNRVRVVEATCPEQVDVRAGWISKPGQTLVCLPHKMVVSIAGKKMSNDEVDVNTF